MATDLTARDAALRYYGRQLASALALGAGVLAASRSLSSSSSSSSSFVTPELVARAKALLLPAALSKQLDAAAGRTLRLELGLLPALSAAALALALAVALKLRSKTKACYLLDFACYKPPEECKVPLEVFLQQSRDAGVFDADALDFQTRVSERNGVSDHAYFPPALHASADERRARLGDGVSATSRTMREAREEAQMVLFGTVSELLARLGLQPSDIDILVVNCSLFNPTPSLSAMIINHFKMRSDVTSFNLAGMGCSAGVLAVQLAQKLLQTQRGRSGGKGAYALVVSTENVTQNWYLGKDRSMLIPNTLFRMGGAAIMLTSKETERPRAKYELQHLVRVHLGADDVAYECVFQREDDAGVVGVELNRDLVKVAGRALERNLTKMGPLVLPLSEQLKFAGALAARALLPRSMRPAAYVPDFKKAFDHFCLHAGGRGVIEGLGKQLGLPADKASPSYNSLYWYGNTSSASVWYALGFIEAAQGVRRGDVVWQVGFGSGFKCNSAVWRALRDVRDARHAAWVHIQDESNLNAVPAYLANGGFSQGPKAPACSGPFVFEHEEERAARALAEADEAAAAGGGGKGGKVATRPPSARAAARVVASASPRALARRAR